MFPPALQAKRGGLKDTLPDDMLATVFKATLQRTGIDPKVRRCVGLEPRQRASCQKEAPQLGLLPSATALFMSSEDSMSMHLGFLLTWVGEMVPDLRAYAVGRRTSGTS